MARTQKLKVYRTAAGFNDAYVAAPSQKAALAAWGSDKDLFARGVAELVTDPALMAEPLASPGTVVKHSRGTTAEQIRSLPDLPPPTPKPTTSKHEDAAGRGPTSKQAKQAKPARTAAPAKPAPKPKPPSARLDAAEDALAAIKSDYHGKMKALADREAALARERRTLEKRQREDVGTAEATVDDERRAYDTAMQRWRRSKGGI